MSVFSDSDWNRLATLFDGVHPLGPIAYDACLTGWNPYPGYKPETVEAPNGDTKACPDCVIGVHRFPELGGGTRTEVCSTCHGSGRVPNVDAAGACTLSNGKTLVHGCRYRCPCGWVFDGTYWPPPRSHQAPGKRYLHVAEKYDPPAWAVEYLARAHWEACKVATALGVPAAYRPHESDGTLRVLDYPPGAGTVEHTDPNLFTIVLWRSHPGDLEINPTPKGRGMHLPKESVGTYAARQISPGLHIGQLGALVGLGPATPHRVPARPYRQRSIVYFAVPDHAARLPGAPVTWSAVRDRAQTVGEWLTERIKRSRVAAGAYR